MRKTKIVATVGPACWKYEQLEALADAGVNVFRMNFSHGDYKSHGAVIKHIKTLNKNRGGGLATMLDTKGPEIRTGDVKAPVQIHKGDKITISTRQVDIERGKKITVNYGGFVDDVEVGMEVLVDSGVLRLKVLEKKKTQVICLALDDAELGSRRHVNIPGKETNLEPITKKDWEDIQFGMEMGVDFVALSFVRTAKEIQVLQKVLKQKKSKIEVIAKIESFEATKHLESICKAADGVMVARGDLGAEVPFSHVPRLQREIIEMAGKYGKPVIVATQMLESMQEHPVPTRAEVADISEAVWQRSDAIMLSGETAGGEYPVRSVEVMAEVAEEAEKEVLKERHLRQMKAGDDRTVLCRTAAQMTRDQKEIAGIVVITRSGQTATALAAYRPLTPVWAFTNEAGTRRKLQLRWGVEARKIDFSSDPEKTIRYALEALEEEFPRLKGKKLVLVSDSLVEGEMVPTLQIRKL